MIKAAEKGLMKIGALLVRPALVTQILFKGKKLLLYIYRLTILKKRSRQQRKD